MSAEPSARLTLSRLLTGVDVHPTSLPPSAILVVRRVSDPAPRTLAAGETHLRPPARWERALQNAIDRAAHDAARPAAGPVPPSATAVLFLDPAELLACLARDFLLGDVSGSWWWQAWVRATGRSTLELVLDAWVRDARHIPAAIAGLQQQGLALRLVRALSAAQARTLLVAIADAYELPALAAPTSSGSIPVPPVPPPHIATIPLEARRDDQPSESIAAETTSVQPPWEPLIAPVTISADLGVEPLALLGVALALHRAPLAVRTRAFQRAFHAWRRRPQSETRPAGQDTSEPERVPPPDLLAATTPLTETERLPNEGDDLSAPPLPTPSDAADMARTHARRNAAVGSIEDGVREASLDAVSDASMPAAISSPEFRRRRSHDARSSEPRPTVVETIALPRAQGRVDVDAQVRRGPAASEDRAVSSTQDTPVATGRRVYEQAVVTECGGVLFLINALQRLQLFDRLDDHFGVASSLGGWGWLEMIARCLLGTRQRQAAADPVWEVLGDLDGRRRDVPLAVAFASSRRWRRPETWPAPARARWRRRRRPLNFEPTSELQRFLDPLSSYVRWRLLQALDFRAPTPGAEDALLASRVLHRRARLEWTATHVDLYMDMNQIDIAVRLAGLDANPGWVPALGRVVTFYFE